MIVIDTNVISEAFQTEPRTHVIAWLDALAPGEGVLCAPVLNEILFLIHAHRLRYGSDRVARQFEALAARRFSETILPFDEAAARACASVRAEQAVRGRTRPASDMPIAGICLVHDLPLATRNVRHFQGIGLDIINPFEPA